MIPGFSTAKLIGFGIAALALIAFLAWVNGLRNERNALKAWQGDVVSVVRSEVPVERRKSVTAKTAGDEIHWLGREYRTHAEALRIQSEALKVAEGKTLAAQNSASDAARRAQEADKPRLVIRRQLADPKRQEGLKSSEWSQL